MAHLDLFSDQPQTAVALRKLKITSENFRVYCCGWLGKGTQRDIMEVIGAEFRVAKRGPHKGELHVMVPGTTRTAYVTAAEINREHKKQQKKGGK